MLKKINGFLLLFLVTFIRQGGALDHEDVTCRFFVRDDPTVFCIEGIPLRSTWWSRPYEYAWAQKFVESNHVVLDAACGISHPFKWFLAERCTEVWASDWDSRITSAEMIIQETLDDLGKEAHQSLLKNKNLIDKVHFSCSSITHFPKEMPQFDRIFCISSLEHMNRESQQKALHEFSRHLKPDGLIILTVDYPVISPEDLLKMGAEAGLAPLGPVDHQIGEKDLITHSNLHIYRCVLRHRSKAQ